MKKLIAALLVVVSLCVTDFLQAAGTHTPFSLQLQEKLGKLQNIQKNPGAQRNYYMYYPAPDNVVRKLSEANTAGKIQAVSFYLYNMYITTAAYQVDMPSRLDFNYVGVLEGFYSWGYGFDFAEAVKFYNLHKKAIKERIQARFKHWGDFPSYQINDTQNDARERAFMELLAKAPRRGDEVILYPAASINQIKGEIDADEQSSFDGYFGSALAQARKLVTTYEVIDQNQWSTMIDNPRAARSSAKKYYYRWAIRECASCSYIIGKELCRALGDPKIEWGNIRINEITAYPVTSGARLSLKGRNEKWDYHRAIFVLAERDGTYTPIVLDKFLGGAKAMKLEEWLKYFDLQKTNFLVQPFNIQEKWNKGLKTPSSSSGNKVKVDGKWHEPYPVHGF